MVLQYWAWSISGPLKTLKMESLLWRIQRNLGNPNRIDIVPCKTVSCRQIPVKQLTTSHWSFATRLVFIPGSASWGSKSFLYVASPVLRADTWTNFIFRNCRTSRLTQCCLADVCVCVCVPNSQKTKTSSKEIRSFPPCSKKTGGVPSAKDYVLAHPLQMGGLPLSFIYIYRFDISTKHNKGVIKKNTLRL